MLYDPTTIEKIVRFEDNEIKLLDKDLNEVSSETFASAAEAHAEFMNRYSADKAEDGKYVQLAEYLPQFPPLQYIVAPASAAPEEGVPSSS